MVAVVVQPFGHLIVQCSQFSSGILSCEAEVLFILVCLVYCRDNHHNVYRLRANHHNVSTRKMRLRIDIQIKKGKVKQVQKLDTNGDRTGNRTTDPTVRSHTPGQTTMSAILRY